ncbi:MAG: 1-acyl-sn-glycerol-3-phosphate acyltransferase [Actinomycetia bacterium]|nr:1-acyl-sn-glycerol-3-phosphate acyltransferase [Actinomycetes bacterium]
MNTPSRITRRPTLPERMRRAMYPRVRALCESDLRMRQGRLVVDHTSARLPRDGRAMVFAANHTNIQDIPRLALALNRPFYTIVAGNATYGLVNWLASWAFGTLWLVGGNDSAADANHAKVLRNAIGKLRRGNNVLIFPEAVWNPCYTWSDGKPMLPLHKGLVGMAREGDAHIIPVVTEYDMHNTCYVHICEPFDAGGYPDDVAAITALRDVMSEAKSALRTTYRTAPSKEVFLAMRTRWRSEYPYLAPAVVMQFVQGYKDHPEEIQRWFLADER